MATHSRFAALALGLIATAGPAGPAACTFADAGVGDAPADQADGGGAVDSDAGPAPGRDEAIAELRDAVRALDQGWRFRPDPQDRGVAEGWAAVDHDDAAWAPIAVDRVWEEQGYHDLDGVAWYRVAVDVPESWRGSVVRWLAGGVDDEYDLFVNGAFVAHYGQRPDRSVYGWQTRAHVEAHLRFGERNVIAVRVTDWGAGGGLWRAVSLRRSVPIAGYAHLLPRPILDDRPAWIELYWAAWQMAFDKISFATATNGFVEPYLDEGFNEQIYQWDSSFMALFARHGARLFPAMAGLDNFYHQQRADGYIQRVYSETTGGALVEPTPDEPMVNPPLFAWTEWEYARTTGDLSRLAATFTTLERYYAWLGANVRDQLGLGLYYQTELGSGMDNTPRRDAHRAGWIDMSAQQALAALYLGRIAGALGDPARQLYWQAQHDQLAAAINLYAWNELEGTYYDIQRNGQHTGVRHLGAYWTLLAQVASPLRAARLVEHLQDPAHFHRAHLFPTLSAADPSYSSDGHYWRGSVWAPTNYMVIRGLAQHGYAALAHEAALNHIGHVADVYASPPAAARIAPEEADGDYRTIWECYAPDHPAPGTRWDETYLSRQDFVGWSGLGPIALLIEQVIGVDVDALAGRVTWDVREPGRHGVERLTVGAGHQADLLAEAAGPQGRWLRLRSDAPFELVVRAADGRTQSFAVAAGRSEVWIAW